MNCKKFKAFTLAEVLITLLIIGIVASIVIPAIVNDTRDAELKTAFKKHYAEISLAYNSLVQDNGGSLKGTYNNVSEFANAFKDKFNYLKYCPVGTASECIPNINEYRYLDTTNGEHPSGCGTDLINYTSRIGIWAATVLNDGSVISIMHWYKGCNASDSYANNSCGTTNQAINIDVNGIKPPNVLGKDLFVIMPYEKTVKPAGISANMTPYTLGYTSCDSAHSCLSSRSGFGCAAKVLGE